MEIRKLKSHLQDILPALCLVLVLVVFQIATGGKMLSAGNVKPFIREAFTILVGASGLAFILSQGAFDFSIAANVAFSAALGAHAASINIYLILPTVLISGLFIGLCNGVIYAYLKVNPFITTLAMSFVLDGLTVVVLRNGSLSCPFEILQWDSIELRLAVMVLIAVAGYILFEKTRVGKECKIVGTNQEFARLAGVNVEWVKLRSYLIMGAIAGLVAFFSLIRSATASTSTGAGFTTSALNAVLLGGMAITGGSTSKFRSAIIGSLVMASLTLGMNKCGLDVYAQQIIEGLVFLIAVSMTFDRKNSLIIK
ncbi:MAG: ABC transporter permease [Oscillospiraceae bacterium]|jgi:ribose transport system permease protein